MFFVSKISTAAPAQCRTPLQQQTYRALSQLHIPFARVDTDEAITMEDCVQIDASLQVKMVKTLFLCNRQQTAFYLFITAGDKPFSSRAFSAALEISRVSFAPSSRLETMLGTKIGAATVFSALLDTECRVQIVVDKAVLAQEWYGCSDGTTTGYLKVRTADILHVFLPFARHTPRIAEV